MSERPGAPGARRPRASAPDAELDPPPPSAETNPVSYTSMLRRVPTRQSSRAKVDRILDAAEGLLIERGYEQAVSSPALIIERADVTGGSFYTYFASPDNVMETLALRLMDNFKAVLDTLVEEVHADWREAARRYSGTVVTFHQHAAARELWIEGHLSRPARLADENANAWAAHRLEHMLSIARVPGPRLEPVCYRVAVEILDYVMRLAYRADGEARERLLQEARHAFEAYLASAGPEKRSRSDR